MMDMEMYGLGYGLMSILGSFFGMCLGAGLPISIAIIIAAYMLKKKNNA